MDGHFSWLGNPGSGKTTLSLALARSGWDFGSDEIVLLCRDLRLRPLPLPACSKANVMSTVAQWFPEIEGALEHDRYGKKIRYLPLRSATFQGKTGFVIFPRYDLSAPNSLQVLDGFKDCKGCLANAFLCHQVSKMRRETVALMAQSSAIFPGALQPLRFCGQCPHRYRCARRFGNC